MNIKDVIPQHVIEMSKIPSLIYLWCGPIYYPTDEERYYMMRGLLKGLGFSLCSGKWNYMGENKWLK